MASTKADRSSDRCPAFPHRRTAFSISPASVQWRASNSGRFSAISAKWLSRVSAIRPMDLHALRSSCDAFQPFVAPSHPRPSHVALRVNSSSLDHPLTMLPEQALEIVGIEKNPQAHSLFDKSGLGAVDATERPRHVGSGGRKARLCGWSNPRGDAAIAASPASWQWHGIRNFHPQRFVDPKLPVFRISPTGSAPASVCDSPWGPGHQIKS
jgi:hypothetical protein